MPILKHCFNTEVKRRFITLAVLLPHNQAMLDNAEMSRRIKSAIDGKLGLSQAAVADAFGVTEQAVSGWIRTGKIDKRKLPKLAVITGVPLALFMPGGELESDEAALASQLPRYDKQKMELAAQTVPAWFEREGLAFQPSVDYDLVLGAYELLVSANSNNVIPVERWLMDQAAKRGKHGVGQREAGSIGTDGHREAAPTRKRKAEAATRKKS